MPVAVGADGHRPGSVVDAGAASRVGEADPPPVGVGVGVALLVSAGLVEYRP
jgi:hypothetical protein